MKIRIGKGALEKLSNMSDVTKRAVASLAISFGVVAYSMSAASAGGVNQDVTAQAEQAPAAAVIQIEESHVNTAMEAAQKEIAKIKQQKVNHQADKQASQTIDKGTQDLQADNSSSEPSADNGGFNWGTGLPAWGDKDIEDIAVEMANTNDPKQLYLKQIEVKAAKYLYDIEKKWDSGKMDEQDYQDAAVLLYSLSTAYDLVKNYNPADHNGMSIDHYIKTQEFSDQVSDATHDKMSADGEFGIPRSASEKFEDAHFEVLGNVGYDDAEQKSTISDTVQAIKNKFEKAVDSLDNGQQVRVAKADDSLEF